MSRKHNVTAVAVFCTVTAFVARALEHIGALPGHRGQTQVFIERLHDRETRIAAEFGSSVPLSAAVIDIRTV